MRWLWLRMGGLVLGVAALSGCSLGADKHSSSGLDHAGAAGTSSSMSGASGGAQWDDPIDGTPRQDGASVADHARDELGNTICASGCDVVGPDQEPSGPVAPGRVQCSVRLDWAHPDWVEVESGPSSGAKLATDSLGNAYFVGTFTGSGMLGPFAVHAPGKAHGFVMKLGSDCTPLELREYGDDNSSEVSISVIAIDRDDNLILGGQLIGDVDLGQGPITTWTADGQREAHALVLKLNAQGELLWHRLVKSNTATTRLYDLAVSATGDIVVSGQSSTNVHFESAPPPDAPGYAAFFVAFLSASGEPGAVHVLSGEDANGSVTADTTGRVAITGYAYRGARATGPFAEVAWSQQLHHHYLLMLDSRGALEHSYDLEMVELDGLFGHAMAFDHSDNLVLQHGRSTFVDDGTFTHHPQTLLKLAPDGTESWSLISQYEGPGKISWAKELATDSHDNIVHVDELGPDVTLDRASFETRGADALVTKRDASGTVLWSTRLGDYGDDYVWGLRTDRDDAVWVGTSAQATDLSHGTITISKLAP
jgi:hypothetical protein